MVGLLGWVSQWALLTDFFNHYLVILMYENQLWGHKPFCFNNHWLYHGSLSELVVSFWNVTEINRWKSFVSREKLRALKVVLRSWNKEIYGELDSILIVIKKR